MRTSCRATNLSQFTANNVVTCCCIASFLLFPLIVHSKSVKTVTTTHQREHPCAWIFMLDGEVCAKAMRCRSKLLPGVPLAFLLSLGSHVIFGILRIFFSPATEQSFGLANQSRMGTPLAPKITSSGCHLLLQPTVMRRWSQHCALCAEGKGQ